MNNNKIVTRLDELRKQMNKKVVWNRTRALNEINYALDIIKNTGVIKILILIIKIEI